MLLNQYGSVGAALLKAVQTLLVVLISASVFCSTDVAQCMDGEKALSVSVVLLGFVVYGGPAKR
jgi:hypothetical protein